MTTQEQLFKLKLDILLDQKKAAEYILKNNIQKIISSVNPIQKIF
jgi:hypothetical protein